MVTCSVSSHPVASLTTCTVYVPAASPLTVGLLPTMAPPVPEPACHVKVNPVVTPPTLAEASPLGLPASQLVCGTVAVVMAGGTVLSSTCTVALGEGQRVALFTATTVKNPRGLLE